MGRDQWLENNNPVGILWPLNEQIGQLRNGNIGFVGAMQQIWWIENKINHIDKHNIDQHEACKQKVTLARIPPSPALLVSVSTFYPTITTRDGKIDTHDLFLCDRQNVMGIELQ